MAYVPQEAWDAYNEQEYASTRAADDITDNKLDALYEEFVLQRFHEMQPLQEVRVCVYIDYAIIDMCYNTACIIV